MELVAYVASTLVAAVDIVALMGTAAVHLLALVNVRASALVAQQKPALRTAALVTANKVAALVRALPVSDLALVDVPLTARTRPAVFANTGCAILRAETAVKTGTSSADLYSTSRLASLCPSGTTGIDSYFLVHCHLFKGRVENFRGLVVDAPALSVRTILLPYLFRSVCLLYHRLALLFLHNLRRGAHIRIRRAQLRRLLGECCRCECQLYWTHLHIFVAFDSVSDSSISILSASL